MSVVITTIESRSSSKVESDGFRPQSPATHHGTAGLQIGQGRSQILQSRVDLYISFPILFMKNSTKGSSDSNRPVQRLSLRGISASVFENTTDKGVPFHKVSITRTYREADGEFKTTNNFSRDDLPLVAELARQAWLSIMKFESDQSSSKDD